MPEPAGHPPRLQRDKPLEVQERPQKSRGRGIVNSNALQIAARRVDQVRRGVMRLTGNAREKLAISRAFAEPFTDLMRERITEIGMIEDRGQQRDTKERIAGQGAF